MKQLECKLVFIKAKAETIRARGIVPGWDQQFMLEYAKKFGGNPEEIHQHFVWEQQKMEELADKSSLEKILLMRKAISAKTWTMFIVFGWSKQ